MNLQQLRYLVAAADLGSVSAAAREVGVTQPVVSRALHGLEREYGLTLFRQSGRCLTLTHAGQSVVNQARQALHACDEVERTARRIAYREELAVVATPTNSTLLSPIVTSFVREHPTTALRLCRAASVEDIIHMVGAGEAELGFGDLWESLNENGLVAHPIWSAEVVIVSPVGTELPPVVRMEELAGSRLVLPLEGTKRRQMIDYGFIDAYGRAPLPALATDERSAWVTSAQQGIGSFFCYKTIARELDKVEVRPLSPPKWVEVGFRYQPASLSEGARAMVRLAAECPVPEGCRPAPSPSLIRGSDEA